MRLKYKELHSLVKAVIEKDSFQKRILQNLYSSARVSVEEWSKFIMGVIQGKNLDEVISISPSDIDNAVTFFQKDHKKLRDKRKKKVSSYSTMAVYEMSDTDPLDIF